MQFHHPLECLAGGGVGLEQGHEPALVVLRLHAISDTAEEVENVVCEPHAWASSANVFSTQSSRVWRILRSIWERALGVVWRVSARSLTEQSGS